MKRFSLLITLVITSFCSVFAQVTTDPVFIYPTNETTFSVIFDATQGNAAMLDVDSCYAHTGVITTASTSDSDWKHAPAWLDNSAKYKMTEISDNLWELTITGGLVDYYDLDPTEEVVKLALVFRDETGDKEGKTADGGDYYYELFQEGDLAVTFVNPSSNQVVDLGTTIEVSALSSASASLSLSINGSDVSATTTATELSYTFLCDTQGAKTLKVKAISDDLTLTLYDSVEVFVKSPVVDADVPEDLLEGINYDIENAAVTLVLRAPNSHNIYVLGDFNDWKLNENYQMFRDSVFVPSVVDPLVDSLTTVLWWCTVPVVDATKAYAFQYLVDGAIQISDPYAEVVLDPWNDQYIEDLIDPTLPDYPTGKGDGVVSVFQITDPNAYEWNIDNFEAPAKEDLVIYELLIRDFSDSKALSGVMAKMDYLDSLGVNAIELMPVTEFDGNISWGYNPNHFFAYDKAYGTKNEYKAFIDECHRRGIAVVLDMVFNHATGICPLAKLYWDGNATADNNPWFNRVAKHDFNVFHDINHEYEGTQSYFKRVLAYWIKEYKVDGYRMDLSKGFTQKNTLGDTNAWGQYDQSRIDILKVYNDAVIAANPNAYFILEHFSDYSEELELTTYGMMPWRNMNNSYCQAAMGWSSESTFVDSDGKGGMFTDNWVGFPESHDEERTGFKMKEYGAGTLQTSKNGRLLRVPLTMAFSQLIPGPKMIWQYLEMGYDYSINHCGTGDVDTDPTTECRTDEKPVPWEMGWGSDSLRQNAYRRSCNVINLRTKHPEFFKATNVSLTNGSYQSWSKPRRIDVNYVAAVEEESVDIIVLGNFSTTADVTTEAAYSKLGTWYNYMTGEAFQVTDLNEAITLKPCEMIIYTSRNIDADFVGIDEEEADAATLSIVYPTTTTDLVNLVSEEDPLAMQLSNMAGMPVLTLVEGERTISLAALSAGRYILKVILPSGVSTYKIIKK